MTDDSKNTLHDDEYQFPQDEYLSSNTSEKPALTAEEHTETEGLVADIAEENVPVNPSPLHRFAAIIPILKNKRIIIAAVCIIVFVIVLRVMNSHKTPTPPASPPPPAPVQTIAQPTAPIATPIVQQPAYNNDALTTLDSRSTHNESQIRDMQTQITDLQNTLTQSQTTNQTLQKTVTDMAEQIKTLSTQLTKLLAAEKSMHKPKKIVYHLRAVLPDRAWIMSKSGETVSVTVGDTVSGYGTVQQIDPQNGVVITSSGRKIAYGENDY